MTDTPSDTPTIETITVDAKALAGLLTDLLLFTSKDDTLPAIAAVQLQQGLVDGESVLIARATDRYALAESYIPISDGKWDEEPISVPNAAVKQLIAVAKSGYFVQLSKTDTQLTINNFNSQATVYTLDAEFPSCSQLWEGTHDDDSEIVCCFEAGALARPSAVAKRRKTSLRLHMNRRSNILATVGDSFRAIIMKQHNREGDGIAYREPSM